MNMRINWHKKVEFDFVDVVHLSLARNTRSNEIDFWSYAICAHAIAFIIYVQKPVNFVEERPKSSRRDRFVGSPLAYLHIRDDWLIEQVA